MVGVNPEEVDKNLAGLIANQLAAKYGHPTLILRMCRHEDGSITWEGSGRNPGRSRLDNLREFLLSTNDQKIIINQFIQKYRIFKDMPKDMLMLLGLAFVMILLMDF